MNDMNIAKLTSDDLPLFIGITSDLFPDIEVPTVDYEEIISYITKEAIKLKLQVISNLVDHPFFDFPARKKRTNIPVNFKYRLDRCNRSGNVELTAN